MCALQLVVKERVQFGKQCVKLALEHVAACCVGRLLLYGLQCVAQCAPCLTRTRLCAVSGWTLWDGACGDDKLPVTTSGAVRYEDASCRWVLCTTWCTSATTKRAL